MGMNIGPEGLQERSRKDSWGLSLSRACVVGEGHVGAQAQSTTVWVYVSL